MQHRPEGAGEANTTPMKAWAGIAFPLFFGCGATFLHWVVLPFVLLSSTSVLWWYCFPPLRCFLDIYIYIYIYI